MPSAKRTAAITGIVLATVFLGLLSLPSPAHMSASPSRLSPTLPSLVHALVRPAPAPAAAPVVAHPAAGYARTVLVEPFSELWCEFCPFESQGLYPLEHSEPSSYMVVAELHPCATGNYSNCQDSWPTLDGIADYRAVFYNLQGYPTVYFDGTHGVIGDVNSDTAKQLEAVYAGAIANASMVPANVSISQTATFTGALQATAHESITSDVSGTYLALTYLTEDIDKNFSGSNGLHDIGNVVRAPIINESVTLTAGQTTTVSGSVALNSNWNMSRLSSVGLVQDSATKIVENSNMVPVTSIVTGVSSSLSTIDAEASSTITVQADDSSTGAPLAGASVSLSLTGGGSLDPMTGVTASDGAFTSTFTAPTTTAQETISVSALVTAPGYTGAPVSCAITVEPFVAPSVPLGVSILPAQSQVELRWSAPASGGSGVTYHVYRASSPTGSFSQVGTAMSTTFSDTSVSSQQPYWYSISAQGAGGFSLNTTAFSVAPLLGSPSGLPATVTWWLQVGALLFNETGMNPIALHLGAGQYAYNLGVDSFAYLTPNDASGTITIAEAMVTLPAVFTPNYAFLQGNVNPSDATVLLNGVAIQLAQGAFSEQLTAGTYTLKVSASGYTTQSASVTLTPGNQTTHDFTLLSNAAPPTTTSAGGLTSTEMLALVGVGVVAVAALAVGLLWGRNRQGPSSKSGNGGGTS